MRSVFVLLGHRPSLAARSYYGAGQTYLDAYPTSGLTINSSGLTALGFYIGTYLAPRDDLGGSERQPVPHGRRCRYRANGTVRTKIRLW